MIVNTYKLSNYHNSKFIKKKSKANNKSIKKNKIRIKIMKQNNLLREEKYY